VNEFIEVTIDHFKQSATALTAQMRRLLQGSLGSPFVFSSQEELSFY